MFARGLTKATVALRAYSGARAASSARKPIIGGNWKCNAGKGTTLQTVDTLLAGLKENPPADHIEVFCAPPSPYLMRVGDALDSFSLSSQNVHTGPATGAFTGEVSAEMLVDLGAKWSLVGHSERRSIYGETDEIVTSKIAACHKAGLGVVACCGEQLEDRESGNTEAVLAPQLQAIADGAAGNWEDDALVIAYEPVWAIGTGVVATPQQAQDTIAWIRNWISENVSAEAAAAVRIQYGGSVNAENCAELSALPDVDGFLVGGASLDAEGFKTIYTGLAEASA